MTASPHSGLEGEVITLLCEGTTDPLKTTAQLLSHVSIEWVGPTGVGLTKGNSIKVGVQQRSTNRVVRTLTINGTMYSHSGVYTCVVTLNSISSQQESVAEYHLTLKSMCHVVLHVLFIVPWFLENITVYESEDLLMQAQCAVGSLRCTWSGGGALPQMEWLFLGDNLIAPLTSSNTTWNTQPLTCWIQIYPPLTHSFIIQG